MSDLCSEAFNIILNNSHEKFLTIESKNAFNMKLFYRQRLFKSVINELKVKFDSTDLQNKGNLKFYNSNNILRILLINKLDLKRTQILLHDVGNKHAELFTRKCD